MIVVAAVEKRIIGERARRHEPDDLPLNDPFGQGWVFHLLANRDAMSRRDHPAEISFNRVERHTRHRNRVFGAEAASTSTGEGHAQRPGGELHVLPEHLIEIPHPKKQHVIGILLLEGLVLLHRRRIGPGAIEGAETAGARGSVRSPGGAGFSATTEEISATGRAIDRNFAPT